MVLSGYQTACTVVDSASLVVPTVSAPSSSPPTSLVQPPAAMAIPNNQAARDPLFVIPLRIIISPPRIFGPTARRSGRAAPIDGQPNAWVRLAFAIHVPAAGGLVPQGPTTETAAEEGEEAAENRRSRREQRASPRAK